MSGGRAEEPAHHRRRVPERPLLPGFFQVIPSGADSVQLRSAGRVVRLSGPGLGEAGVMLLSALDGHSTTDELAERFGLPLEMVEHVVSRLSSDGVVCDAGWYQPEPGHLAAHERYALVGKSPSQVQSQLEACRLAMVGLGPVARIAVGHLVAAGVGEVVLADEGVVSSAEASVLASTSATAGRRRADVAAEELRGVMGERRLTVSDTSADALARSMDGADLVVVEADEAGEQVHAAQAACLSAGTPMLVHQENTFEAVVGPAVQRGRSACYQCLVQRRRSHLRYYDEHLAYLDQLRRGRLAARRPALLGGEAAVVGGLVSLEALRLLSGFEAPVTVGAVLVADLRASEVRREEVLQVPGCPGCWAPDFEVVTPPADSRR